MAVTEKQRRFVEAFLRTGDGEVALAEAGYPSHWTPERAMAKISVREVLESRCMADETEVAAFLSLVMRGKPTEKEQLKAAELLGKHFGMFERRKSGMGGGPAEIVGDELLED